MDDEILIDDDLGNVLHYEKEMKHEKDKDNNFNKKKKTKINSRRYSIKDKIESIIVKIMKLILMEFNN